MNAIAREFQADGYLVISDVDNPENDFLAVRPHDDGSIEFAIRDTVNTNGITFSSMSKEEAKSLAAVLLLTI